MHISQEPVTAYMFEATLLLGDRLVTTAAARSPRGHTRSQLRRILRDPMRRFVLAALCLVIAVSWPTGRCWAQDDRAVYGSRKFSTGDRAGQDTGTNEPEVEERAVDLRAVEFEETSPPGRQAGTRVTVIPRGRQSASGTERSARIGPKLTLARSGPGLDFYPTDALPAGTEVTVVRQVGDWVAIVPPEGSFCWVDGEGVEWQPGQTRARVVTDHLPAWIGSNVLAVSSHRAHVHLGRGDVLSVLDVKALDNDASDNSSARRWLKVRPPPGDVRWIEQKALIEETSSPSSEEKPAKSFDRSTRRSTTQDSSAADHNAERPNIEVSQSEASNAEMSKSGDSDEWFPRWADQRFSRFPVSDQKSGRDEAKTRANWPLESEQDETASFEDRAVQIRLALSRAAARQADVEEFDRWVAAAEQLVRRAQAGHERARARELYQHAVALRKIAEEKSFQTVQGESLPEVSSRMAPTRGRRAESVGLAVNPNAEDTRDSRQAEQSLHGDNRDSTEPADVPAGKTPYVAQGWLMPVASAQGNAPPFVITDADGHPLAFVTPAPGVNLRRYVDQHIGVIGQRGFDVLQFPHVIAHRAVKLDSRTASVKSSPW